jgi:AraC-like DNA-binding protein
VEGLSGLRTVIYDHHEFTTRAGRSGIDYSFVGHRSAFCTLMRSSAEGIRACVASDVKGAVKEASRRGRPFLHTCHAGLVEIVVPVMLRGEHVATVFCGQAVIDECPAADGRWLAERARVLHLDPQKAHAARRALPRSDKRHLRRIGRLLHLALSRLAESEGRAALDRALALHRSDAMRNAVAFIDEHATENIGIEQVAAEVGVSTWHLCRLFRQTLGATFSDYLTERRVAEAREMLCSTSMSVLDIATAVGYASQSYFGRKFKQVAGQTPMQYRRANRK